MLRCIVNKSLPHVLQGLILRLLQHLCLQMVQSVHFLLLTIAIKLLQLLEFVLHYDGLGLLQLGRLERCLSLFLNTIFVE